VCANLIKGYYELFRVDRLSADDIRKRLHIDGEEHGLQAIARGRGVIFVAPHFGNVDITAQIPRLYGLTVTVVAEHIRPERVYRYVLGLRASHGMRFLPSDGPMLGLFRALKRGEAIGLACDRTVTENGREMMFFGAPARLPDGAIVLARRTGAVVLPARALRLPDDTFHIQVEPPIEIERTEDPEADVIAGMECLVRIMERWIGAHPDQWLLTVPIWQQAEAR
jgi:KDO2-lipid IV(A) lauroyltransferase